MEKVFPVTLIVLDFASAVVYGSMGDIKRAIYWVSAGVLTICVTF